MLSVMRAIPTIYMDESGDLGFDFTKQKTSSYFVVSFLFCSNPRRIDKIIKKIFSGFSKIEVKNHHGILHAYKERPTTRVRLLRELQSEDIAVLTIRLNKHQVYTRLHDEKHVLYNYVVNILLDRMVSKKLVPLSGSVRFVASKRETNKFLNDNFSAYLKGQTDKNHSIKLEIEVKKPSEEKGLQAVDCVAWSFFRKYEQGDSSYADILAPITVEESKLF